MHVATSVNLLCVQKSIDFVVLPLTTINGLQPGETRCVAVDASLYAPATLRATLVADSRVIADRPVQMTLTVRLPSGETLTLPPASSRTDADGVVSFRTLPGAATLTVDTDAGMRTIQSIHLPSGASFDQTFQLSNPESDQTKPGR